MLSRRAATMAAFAGLALAPALARAQTTIEELPPDAYDKLSYYEKWISSLTQTLLQRGIITTEELGRKMEEVERRVR